MFSLCLIHDVEKNLTVSIAIKDALINNFPVKEWLKLTIVKPDEDMNRSYLFIDRELYFKLGFGECSEVFLYDRDKENKELNDRVIIIKLRRLVSTVCPQCLFEKLGLSVCD